MPRDEIKRPQRQQVSKQIDTHLDPGQLVKLTGQQGVTARVFGEDLPVEAGTHVDALPWRGYWYIKEQNPTHLPGPSSFLEYFLVSIDDPTNSWSNLLYKMETNGTLYYEFIPESSEDENLYQDLNFGMATTFVSTVTGRLPLLLQSSSGDKYAVYQDGNLVPGAIANDGGSLSIPINLRKGTKTTIAVYMYSDREVSSEDTDPKRFIRIITPLANYASSYESASPDEPYGVTATSTPDGIRLNWYINPTTAQYVLGTQIYGKRDDEENFRLIENIDNLDTNYLHATDVYEHFDNGILSHIPETIYVGGFDTPYGIMWTHSYGYFLDSAMPYVDNGAYAESINDGRFAWQFGSDDTLPSTIDGGGVAFYHILNPGDAFTEFSSPGPTQDLKFPVEETTIDTTLEAILGATPPCPDSTGFFCSALLPSLVTEGEWGQRHFAVRTDFIPLNGDYDFNFTINSLLAYAAKYTVAGGLDTEIAADDTYVTTGPEVYFRTVANSGEVIYESSQWTSIGNLTLSRNNSVGEKLWGNNSLIASAADMTANIVDLIPEGSDFAVSGIQFKVDLVKDSQDYDQDNDTLYYKVWMIGGAHLFPVQGTILDPGVEYTYKLRHYTDTHVLSGYSSEVSAFAMMQDPPDTVVSVSVSNNSKWNNSEPLTIVATSLSPLDNAPMLQMRHTGSANIYGFPYIEPNGPLSWIDVPVSLITQGNDDPDHYVTTWTLDMQAMYDMGLWPDPLAQVSLPWEHDTDDPYFHSLTQADEFAFKVTANPIGSPDPIEQIFFAAYDTEPPASHLEVTDIYTRNVSGNDGYTILEGGQIADGPSTNDVTYLVKFTPRQYNDVSDIAGVFSDPQWRVKGSEFRVVVTMDNGVPLYKPISILNGDIDAATEYIYDEPYGGVPMTVHQYYDSFVSDHWGNPVTNYGLEYVQALTLSTDYDSWREFNMDSVYEIEFTVPASSTMLGLDIAIQVKNDLGEIFEYSGVNLTLETGIETYGYTSSVSTGEFTGYKLLEDVFDPYLPLDPPPGGGWANKWSVYTDARIVSINTVVRPTDTIWTGDTVALVGLNFEEGTNTAPPFKFYQYHQETDPDWSVLSDTCDNPFQMPIRAITHDPDTETVYIGGPFLQTGYPNDTYNLVARIEAGPGQPISYWGLSGLQEVLGSLYDAEVANTTDGKRVYIFGDIGASLLGPQGSTVGFRLDENGGFDFIDDNALGIQTPIDHLAPGRVGKDHNGTMYIGGGLDSDGWVGYLIDNDNGNGYCNVQHGAGTANGGFDYPVHDLWIDPSTGGMVAASGLEATFGCLYYSGDGGITWTAVDSGFTDVIYSIEFVDGGLFLAGRFDSHNSFGSDFRGAAHYQLVGGVPQPLAYKVGTPPFFADREVCKLHRDENKKYVYYAGYQELYRWNLQTQEWEHHPVDPKMQNNLSYAYGMYTYDYVTQGALLPPDFRDVYTELNGGSPPAWDNNVGPYMCMMIGELPLGSAFADPVEYPFLNHAFISSRTAATVGLKGDGINGFVYRFSDTAGQFLENLYDNQYGPQYDADSDMKEIDKGHQMAKLLSTYVVRHFNPDSIMDADDFISDYVNTDNSLVTVTQTGKWYANEYPATSAFSGGELSDVGIYSPSGSLFYPALAPVSNVFAFTLDRPPGVSAATWQSYNGGPVTLLCFPMSDVTGGEYGYPASGIDYLGITDTLYADRVAMIGGVETQYNVVPTTDYIHVTALKTTKSRNVGGADRALSERQKSVFTGSPGFVPTYSMKYLTDDDSVFENSGVVYCSSYKEGAILETYVDSTSGTYSIGPIVGANESGQKINNHSIIATDVGESYVLSESGAKSYAFQDFNDIINPETGQLAHPNIWFGGDQYNLQHGYQIQSPKMTALFTDDGAFGVRAFSYIRKNVSGGNSSLIVQGKGHGAGAIFPYGSANSLTIPGGFETKYYDIISKPSGDGMIAVTSCGPVPYSSSLNSSGGVDTDNWSFYFHDYSLNAVTGGVTRGDSYKLTFNLDSPSARSSWGVYGFREPNLAWAGKDSNGNEVLLLTFVVDFGTHSDTYADAYVTESRVVTMLVKVDYAAEEWDYYASSSVDPVDGDILNHIVRTVSPYSRPDSWSMGNNRFDGYGIHYSPQAWTNCVINDGEIVESATSAHIAYIVNGVGYNYAMQGEEHKWNSGKWRPIESYGSVHYCVRRLVPDFNSNTHKYDILAPLGEQFRNTRINAAEFCADQDNWGNVVFAYSTRPSEDKVNQHNFDKVYPRYRILSIDKVKRHLPEKELTRPMEMDQI